MADGDETGMLFLMGPGCDLDDPVADRLLREHEAEAARHGAEFGNYGCFQGLPYEFESKTSKGRLYSRIDPDRMEVTHTWTPYGAQSNVDRFAIALAIQEMEGATKRLKSIYNAIN